MGRGGTHPLHKKRHDLKFLKSRVLFFQSVNSLNITEFDVFKLRNKINVEGLWTR